MLPPSEDSDQRDRRDASTSYGGGADGSRSTPGRSGGDGSAAPDGRRSTVRLTKAHRVTPGARQLPDSLRAGVGMAGVPVDGANRTVRMRRVPRYQQQQQQQQQEQQRQRGGSLMDNSGGVSVIDWDAVDWETDVQLREEEAQQVRQVRRVTEGQMLVAGPSLKAWRGHLHSNRLPTHTTGVVLGRRDVRPL